MRPTLTIALALVLFGCGGPPVTKVPKAIGGSKADGTIRMAYDEGAYETVNINWQAADANALRRCKAWGYTAAESFAGGTRKCVERGRGIFNGVPVGQCARYQHTKDYQCSG